MKQETLYRGHAIFCTANDKAIRLTGTRAEQGTLDYIVDNLFRAGDYRILVNYNMLISGPGAVGSLEIDLIVINKSGIFLIEVKDWQGQIEAFSDEWIADGKKRPNPLISILNKAKIFKSAFFGPQGYLHNLQRVSVKGIVVLYRGRHRFQNRGIKEPHDSILDLQSLIRVLASTNISDGSHEIADEEIYRITEAVHGRFVARRDELVRNYRILGELSGGDLFDAYEAQNLDIPERRVRLKRYQLPSLVHRVEDNIRHFKRSAAALARLGFHKNIVGTIDFFDDPARPDVYYEVTELVDGIRLDDFLARQEQPIELKRQLEIVEGLSTALALAHNYKDKESGRSLPIYHRNISPETVYLLKENEIKLADFDFAKVEGQPTIKVSGQILVDNGLTAPELLVNPSSASPASDIYSLGALWLIMARHPQETSKVKLELVDQLPLTQDYREIMKKMLDQSPLRRIRNVEQLRFEINTIKQNSNLC